MHPLFKVTSVEVVALYTLLIGFDDGTQQEINFEPVLSGELFGPLRDRALFTQVKIDEEVATVVWPNGADFDPATLHDWPLYADELAARARRWDLASV